jgi:NitT/TauT family transport system substrate-binding protein
MLALALSMAGFASAQPLGKVSLASTGLSTLYNLPLIVAERKGYFKEEGLEVELIDFAGGSRVMQAVVGGSADVGAGGYDHVLTMKDKGIDIRAFVQFMRYPAMTIGITQATAANYKTPADLKGKIIGVSAPGSSTHGVLLAFLEKNGLKQSDVSVIGLGGPSTALAAVQSGKVDAICYVDPVMSMLEANKTIRIIADTRNRNEAEAILGGEWPAAVIYASQAFIEKRPAVVQAITSAMQKSLAWIAQASPEQIVAVMPPEYVGSDKTFYMQTFTKFRDAIAPPQLISETSARNGLAAAAALNPSIKPATIDIAATLDNRFMRTAMQKTGK